MKTGITLITMGHGNPKALLKTLESTKDVVDEIIFGDLFIFEQDRLLIESYKEQYNLKRITLGFDFIFKNGFGETLNKLAAHASNEIVMYLNVSETFDGEQRVVRLINELLFNYNAWGFDHATDTHTWFRTYRKSQLKWSGLIHEELEGERNFAPYYIFRMKDEDKDMDDSFKAKVMNDVKEIVYFHLYTKLVDNPELLGMTSPGWVTFATENYESMMYRLNKKGKRYQAFLKGDFKKYMDDILENKEFEAERFESSNAIEFQGSPMFLGKK